MLKLADIKKAMEAKLADSTLDQKDIKKLRLTPKDAAWAAAQDLPAASAGFVIPYWSLDGNQTQFWRMRYVEDTRKGFDKLSGRKPLRYVQPRMTNEIYLPPYIDWRKIAQDAECPLIITEGELKAACAVKHGLPTIGLGGVYCFKSTKSGQHLLPQLREFAWSGRTVTICYDSDAVSNQNVLIAEGQLAKVLTAEGAAVYIARLHAADGKLGLDDAIAQYGMEYIQDVLNAASEYAPAAALHQLNTEVVYVRDPGIIYAFTNNMRMTAQAFTGHAYSNRHHYEEVASKDATRLVKKPTAKAWMEWEQRAELDGITFSPGEPKVTDRKLNTWDGWATEPKKGDVKPWYTLLDHLFDKSETEARKWFEQWCAYPLQHPGAKMASAAALWGVQHGTGKSMVGHTLMRIYGKYSAEIKDNDLDNSRNEWAQDKQFILADDITGKDNRRFIRKLMTMITQKEVNIDPKYIPSYRTRDCMNYYFTSNEPDCFYLDDCDRRFFIHEVKADKLPKQFRDAYVQWRDSEDGIAALFHYLLNVDLRGFDPQAEAMVTIAKRDMTHIGKSDLGAWVAELRHNGDRLLKLKGDLFTAAELLTMYDALGTGKVTANGMARELRRSGYTAPGSGGMAQTKHGNVRLYAVRNADQWRRASTAQIVKHYEEHRGVVIQDKAKKY